MTAALTAQKETLLDVQDLALHYPASSRSRFGGPKKYVKAVDGVSFSVYRGETLGLVGESGCGKSSAGRAILQLIKPTRGRVSMNGIELTQLSSRALRHQRREMQMIFQDPYGSLNAYSRIEKILSQPLAIHHLVDKASRRQRVQELLQTVGIDPVLANRYPHEFSGGQRQRIGIARALAVQPSFVVCDEPMSALDVSIQAQMLKLLERLQDEFQLTYLFISHDLGVVRHACDRVAVMYLGKILELASTDGLFENPLHPYTKGLLSAVPIPDPHRVRPKIKIRGDIEPLTDTPTGCAYRNRCPFAQRLCGEVTPPLVMAKSGHQVACHYWQELDGVRVRDQQ